MPLVLKPAIGSAAEFSMKWGCSLPASHPVNRRLAHALAEVLKETDGKVEIRLFSDGQLGGDSDMLSQVRSGALEFYSTAGITVASLVPEVGIINMPFAFPAQTDAWRAMDGLLGQHVLTAISKMKLHPFGTPWENGFRALTTTSRVVNVPGDLSGLKIRVPPSPIATSLFKALGATPTILNVSDVYTALQTRVIDGQENPLVTIDALKFYEVQKFCALTNHMWDAVFQVANAAAWKKLPPNFQEIVERNINKAGLLERIDIGKAMDLKRAELGQKGLKFNTPSIPSFREKLISAGFYQQWKEKYGNSAWSILEKYCGPLT